MHADPDGQAAQSHLHCFAVANFTWPDFSICNLQLAVGCRHMLKEKRYAFPPVKMELAGDFFTILITFAMEAAESDSYNSEGLFLQPAPS